MIVNTRARHAQMAAQAEHAVKRIKNCNEHVKNHQSETGSMLLKQKLLRGFWAHSEFQQYFGLAY